MLFTLLAIGNDNDVVYAPAFIRSNAAAEHLVVGLAW